MNKKYIIKPSFTNRKIEELYNKIDGLNSIINQQALKILQLKKDKKKAIKYIDEEVLFEDMFGEGEDTFLEDVNTKYYKGLKELLGDKENESNRFIK